MPKATWKIKLSEADTGDLLHILEKIIKTYPEVRVFLETKILGDDDKLQNLLKKAKIDIENKLIPKTPQGKIRFKERIDLQSVKKVLTQFKKLKPKPEYLADLYLTYCICLAIYLDQAADFGYWFDVPEFVNRYNSLETALEDMVEIIQENSLQTLLYPKIQTDFVKKVKSLRELQDVGIDDFAESLLT